MRYVGFWWWLGWLWQSCFNRPKPHQWGMVKELGNLPWPAYKSIKMGEYITRRGNRRPCKAEYTMDFEVSTLRWYTIPLKWLKYKLRFDKKEPEVRDLKHSKSFSPEAERWMPTGHIIPGGYSVAMTQRFGRRRAIRFVESRQIVKAKLAERAAVERAVAFAKVSNPLKKRRNHG